MSSLHKPLGSFQDIIENNWIKAQEKKKKKRAALPALCYSGVLTHCSINTNFMFSFLSLTSSEELGRHQIVTLEFKRITLERLNKRKENRYQE